MTTEQLEPVEEFNYFEHPSLSRSDLVDILTSPAYWYKKKKGDIPQKESVPMDEGRAVHMALLEPEKFNDNWIVLPQLRLPSGAYAQVKGRCKWKELKEEKGYTYFEIGTSDAAKDTLSERLKEFYHTDKILLPQQFEMIDRAILALQKHRQANIMLIGDIETEVPFFGTIDGVEMKCQVDIVQQNVPDTVKEYLINHKFISPEYMEHDLDILYDFKFTDRAIRPDIYTHNMKKFGQDIQSYVYRELYYQTTGRYPLFFFIVQNKKSYEAIFYKASDDVLESGEAYTNIALGLFNKCNASGQWNDYVDPDTGATNEDQLFEIHMPGFYKDQL